MTKPNKELQEKQSGCGRNCVWGGPQATTCVGYCRCISAVELLRLAQTDREAFVREIGDIEIGTRKHLYEVRRLRPLVNTSQKAMKVAEDKAEAEHTAYKEIAVKLVHAEHRIEELEALLNQE